MSFGILLESSLHLKIDFKFLCLRTSLFLLNITTSEVPFILLEWYCAVRGFDLPPL